MALYISSAPLDLLGPIGQTPPPPAPVRQEEPEQTKGPASPVGDLSDRPGEQQQKEESALAPVIDMVKDWWTSDDATQSNKENKENRNAGFSRLHNKSPATRAYKPQNPKKACWQGCFHGWLEMKQKKGWISSDWMRVWCVIGKEGKLFVFEAQNSPKPLHMLPLHATVIKDAVEKEAKGRYEVLFDCPKKQTSIRMRSKNKDIKKRWMEEVRKAVCRPNKHSLSQFEVQYKHQEELTLGKVA